MPDDKLAHPYRGIQTIEEITKPPLWEVNIDSLQETVVEISRQLESGEFVAVPRKMLAEALSSLRTRHHAIYKIADGEYHKEQGALVCLSVTIPAIIALVGAKVFTPVTLLLIVPMSLMALYVWNRRKITNNRLYSISQLDGIIDRLSKSCEPTPRDAFDVLSEAFEKMMSKVLNEAPEIAERWLRNQNLQKTPLPMPVTSALKTTDERTGVRVSEEPAPELTEDAPDPNLQSQKSAAKEAESSTTQSVRAKE